MFGIFKKSKIKNVESQKMKEELEELTKTKKSIITLRKLYDELQEEKIKEEIKEIIRINEKIYKEVSKDSSKVIKIYNYNKYYTPTLIRVIKQYIELKNKRISTLDAKKLFIKIEVFTSKIKSSLEKLYQSLFDDQILDIDAEIKVMIEEMKI